MTDREKVIKELESLRDICNAKSNMAIGKGKIAWAGYANTADDAIALLKEQKTEHSRIMEIIWGILHEGLSIDTVQDQDWVYERIRHAIEDT